MAKLFSLAMALAILSAGAGVCIAADAGNGQQTSVVNIRMTESDVDADAEEGTTTVIEKIPGLNFVFRKQREHAMTKAAYLGVATVSVDREQGEKLGLAEGVGLSIMHVDPESPAAAAGIVKGDVLWKLNDQILINSNQLTVLVRTFKADDKVTLELFRDGEQLKLTAGLAEKEMPRLNVMALNVVPDEIATRLQTHEQILAAMRDTEHDIHLTRLNGKLHLTAKDKQGTVLFDGPIDTEEQRAEVPPEIMRKAKKFTVVAAALAYQQMDADGTPKEPARVTMSRTYVDAEHIITWTRRDAGRHLLARDKQGRVLFDGPIDTEEQRAAVPAEIMDKIENLFGETKRSLREEMKTQLQKDQLQKDQLQKDQLQKDQLQEE